MTLTDQERGQFAADWAISRDLETALIALLEERRPRTVIELGAGLSTILLLRYAEQTGAATIHLDQPGRHHANLLSCLKTAGLSPHFVRACPLVEDFYSPSLTADCDSPFDLVIIDGPRGSRARTSAAGVQFLARVIGRRSIVVADDTNRTPELRLVDQIANWFGSDHFERREVRDSVFTPRRSTLLIPRTER